MGPNADKLVSLVRKYASSSQDERLKIAALGLCDMYEELDRGVKQYEDAVQRVKQYYKDHGANHG